VFDNYFSTSYLTPVSEVSVQTGKYPITSGVVNFESPLRGDIETLAEVLKTNGWQTGAFGSSLEFQYYPAMRASFDRGFDVYSINSDLSLPWLGRGTLGVGDALAWTQTQISAGKPFFLWLTVGSAHWPYGEDEPHHFSDPAYAGPLADANPYQGNSVSILFNKKYGTVFDGSIYDDQQQIVKNDASADIAYVRNRYDDGLVMTDRKLAPMLDLLERPDVASRTIVIIESEHGEDFGEHGYIAHYDILDTQTHVPLIVKIPGLSPRRLTELASGVDVMPTLLGALRISAPSSLDGANLLGYMTSTTAADPNTEIFLTRTPLWERIISPFVPSLAAFAQADNTEHNYDTGIRTQRWELIHRLSRGPQQKYSWWGLLTGKPVVLPEYELYDLTVDSGETHNVYSIHAKDADIAALRGKLGDWEKKMRMAMPAPSTNALIQPYF